MLSRKGTPSMHTLSAIFGDSHARAISPTLGTSRPEAPPTARTPTRPRSSLPLAMRPPTLAPRSGTLDARPLAFAPPDATGFGTDCRLV